LTCALAATVNSRNKGGSAPAAKHRMQGPRPHRALAERPVEVRQSRGRSGLQGKYPLGVIARFERRSRGI
jgi:hypothetical protein